MTTPESGEMAEYGEGRTGTSELEPAQPVGDPIPDPGPAPPAERMTDIDLKAEQRVERQVASMFGLASLLILAFLVAFVIFPLTTDDGGAVDVGAVRVSNVALGVTLGLALVLIGLGAIHWARKLMTSKMVIHERHQLRSTDDVRAETLADFELGTAESTFGRRKMIRNSLIGAMALLPLPAVFLLRDLGPAPGGVKKNTLWDTGVRVVHDRTFAPIRPSELQVGSLVVAMPENFEELPHEGPERINQRAKSPVFLIRIDPDDLRIEEGRENWQVDGILCYSKICTHVGCPITLYESDTHHMLCPCHQSTFNLADAGEVIFGPAARPLPQLPLAVDEEGYLIAQSDFVDPVGPSFWEMNT
ncbi:MAG TPA: Rieske 2Fe-2S domain-containing protein [Jiangellaceae bacterium]